MRLENWSIECRAPIAPEGEAIVFVRGEWTPLGVRKLIQYLEVIEESLSNQAPTVVQEAIAQGEASL